MRRKSAINAAKLALGVAFLGAALGALFSESLFLGKALVPADALRAFPPWASAGRAEPANRELTGQALVEQPLRQFRHAEARAGRLPLWNPQLACGVPQLAFWRSAALFPVELLLAPLDPYYSAGLAAFLKLLLAGAFMMLYLRGLDCGAAAAAFGGVCYALSGPLVLHAGGNLLNSALWLPLLFYCIDRAQSRPRFWALFAPALAASALGGDAETTGHAALACAAYFLWRAGAHPRARARHGGRFLARRAAAFAAASAAAALLAAPQLFPTIELAAQGSWSRALGLADGRDALSPASLLLYLQPYLAGAPTTGFEELGRLLGIPAREGFGAHTGYVGVLGLFMAVAALRFRRDRDASFHGLLLAAALAGAHGLPPLSWLYARLPAADPPRLLALACFPLCVLAGMGVELAAAPARPAGFKRFARLFAASAGVAAFAAAYLVGSSELAGELGAAGFVRRQFLMPFAGALLAALIAERGALARLRLTRLACAGWAALDLLWFGLGVNPAVARADYFPLTPALAALREAAPARAGAVGSALPPNAASAYGLADFRAAGGLALPRYEALAAAEGSFGPRGLDAGFPTKPELLGLARLLTPPGWAAPEGWTRRYSGEAEVYEPPGPNPRAAIVSAHESIRDPAALLARARSPAFDPRELVLLEEEPPPPPEALAAPPLGAQVPATLRLTRADSAELEFELSSPRSGFLVVFDAHYPGWKAELDARPVPLLRADYAFRALALPAGRSRARLRFEPDSFRLGVLVAAAAAVLLCLGWLRLRRAEDGNYSPPPRGGEYASRGPSAAGRFPPPPRGGGKQRGGG